MQVERIRNRKQQPASNVVEHQEQNTVRKQGSEEPMESSNKSDAKSGVNSVRIVALLIGRNLHNERVCYIGGVANAKYTTPHDIALR
jgi:hypothetical protein